ncbi:Aste57867_14218 [Aphanomyces stellatus]|uniref:Aste57867_14218 protein n=1 Tax=Aphanomyces stellatus TaxID=120398 RepID=A0A485L0P2_9STRA|nr:hypothetical protein As57867_014167 [Aphanomyces stellatus]VFT91043.1 Aste57867_14218 [Aphanomyces stellatus]
MALLAKLTLLPQASAHLAAHGVLGVRGYVLILTSFLSVFLDVRVIPLRDARLVQATSVPPSLHVSLLRLTHGLPFQLDNYGVWLDLKALFFAGLVVVLLLRVKFQRVLFVPTVMPHCALSYSSPLLFSTWFGSLVGPLVDKKGRDGILPATSLDKDRHTHEPRLWHNPAFYLYERHATHVTFYHPLPLKRMAAWKDEDPTSFRLLENDRLVRLSWKEQIRVE